METTLQTVPKTNESELLNRPPDEGAFSVNGFEHAQRVAKMLSASSLIPKDYQGNIQNTMIALEMANRIGASPIMVMQNLYVVLGKPSWSGPFIIASLNSCGRFSPLRFIKDGKDDDYGYSATARDSSGELLEGPKVTWKMVKEEGWYSKAGSKWKTMPELMFRYRAAAFFGRLYAPDILMGMQSAEEVYDVHNPAADGVSLVDLELLYDMKKEFLAPEEIKNAQRIIENKEITSYSKLFKLLQSK